MLTDFASPPPAFSQAEHNEILWKLERLVQEVKVELVYSSGQWSETLQRLVPREAWGWVEGERHLYINLQGLGGHHKLFEVVSLSLESVRALL
jgi:hypothetical protein